MSPRGYPIHIHKLLEEKKINRCFWLLYTYTAVHKSWDIKETWKSLGKPWGTDSIFEEIRLKRLNSQNCYDY